jgi:DNA-directed RNA polymerase specialized sigma24 family protein
MILFAEGRGWHATTWPGRGVTKDRPRAIRAKLPAAPAGHDADSAVTALYEMHYRSLVRLAALLVPAIATAEQIVQDSFVAMHAAWPSLPDADSALAYLYRSVVNRAESALREHPDAPDLPGSGTANLVSALRALPARQQEVLVLRYFADLSEAQIARTMGVSPGTVEALAIQAMTMLQAKLGTHADLTA